MILGIDWRAFHSGDLATSFENSAIKRANQRYATSPTAAQNQIAEAWAEAGLDLGITKGKGNVKIRQTEHNRQILREMTDEEREALLDIPTAKEWRELEKKNDIILEEYLEYKERFEKWLYNTKDINDEHEEAWAEWVNTTTDSPRKVEIYKQFRDEFFGGKIGRATAPPEAPDSKRRKAPSRI